MSNTNEQTPKGTQEEKEIVDPTLTKKDLEGEEDEQEFNPDGSPKIKEEKKEEKKEEEISPTDPNPVPPKTPETIPPKKEETPDYKKKFGDSTRRNQIVESQFRELQKTLGDITKQEIPSDEEMKLTDPDWEYRNDFEKAQAIKLVVLERRQNLILNSIGSITRETEEMEKLGEFIDSVPQLKGKEEEFIEFTRKPSNKGASMEVLLSAFLFEVKDETPADPTPKPEEIPPSLERATPTGGDAPKPKTGYSDEELKELRTKNPKKYFKLIREGKI